MFSLLSFYYSVGSCGYALLYFYWPKGYNNNENHHHNVIYKAHI